MSGIFLFPYLCPVMMKKYLFILLVLTSCVNKKPVPQQAVISTPAKSTEQAPMDTITLGSKTFLVYSMDESPFESEPAVESDSAEVKLLNNNDGNGHVKRKGNDLIITADNGKTVVLTDKADDEKDGDSYSEYTYTGYLSDIKEYGIFATYYESMDFLLVNQVSSETIHTWGPPIISPDKKYFICSSYDLEAGFIENGLQLYSYLDGKITPVGEISLEKWGPGQIKWLDNKTLAAEYITLDSTMTKVIKPVKLVMQ
jgi:hypothetical protein